MTPILLERETVLAEMEGLARKALRGTGQMLLLRGEAGIGKSAALHHFLDTVASRMQVLLGYCDALSAPRPLSPLVDMLARLPGAQAARLGMAIGAGESESIYARLLDVLGDGQRWVCVIEDVHWADGVTLDLLRFLARRVDALPVLIVASYRDDELGPEHPLAVALGDLSNHAALTRINLPPLSAKAVRELVADSGVDAEQLHRLTGGNPFYVNELLAAGTVGARVGELPRSVSEAVWGRLARLSEAGRKAAEAAAVYGPHADPHLVEKLCVDGAAGLGECIRAGMLVASGGLVRFRHEIARWATLERIPECERQATRQLAEAALAHPPNDPDMTAPMVLPPATAGESDPRQRLANVRSGNGYRHRADTRAHPHGLTRRECEILELVALGHSDADIARTLCISQRTANNHVHAILSKLGVQNRTQAATYANTKVIGIKH